MFWLGITAMGSLLSAGATVAQEQEPEKPAPAQQQSAKERLRSTLPP